MLVPVALAVPAEAREPLDVRIFARVPTPGYPKPVALGDAGRRGTRSGLRGLRARRLPLRTDIDQALIWKVPPGGGKARVWLTDQRFDSPFGPNGIQFTEDGRTLLFAVTFVGPSEGDPTTGALFQVRVGRDDEPRRLREFWHSRRFDAPDGFAIARSEGLRHARRQASAGHEPGRVRAESRSLGGLRRVCWRAQLPLFRPSVPGPRGGG